MSVKVTADGTLGLYQETIGVSPALQVNSDVPVTIASDLTTTGTFNVNGTMNATGAPVLLRDIQEATTPKTGATGTVTHNTATSHIFDHTSIASNFVVNLTNLNTSLLVGYATTVTLILHQGGTAYIPTAVQINGVAQTLRWQGAVPPVGTASGTDIVTFSIVRTGSGTTDYYVFGQLTSF